MVCTSEFWEMYAWEILDKQTSAMLIFKTDYVRKFILEMRAILIWGQLKSQNLIFPIISLLPFHVRVTSKSFIGFLIIDFPLFQLEECWIYRG